MSLQGVGKLINAVLLSLMRHVWVYAALPSYRVNSSAPLVCRHDRVTWEASGRMGYWMTLYLFIYTARLLVSVIL